MKYLRILSFPVTPVLAALYPVLFFWSVNVNQAGSEDAWRSLLTCLGIGLALSILLWVLLRDSYKASLAGALIALPFLSYGHVYTWFVNNHITYIRHTYLLPVFAITIGVLLILVIRSRRDLRNLVSAANIILLALSLYTVFPIARSLWEEARIDRERANTPVPAGDSNQPDIYLIVLDEYPRADVLMRSFQFDNTPFLDGLKSMGFRVIPCSQSNYRWTIQSVYSMLNLEYISRLPDDTSSFMDTTTEDELTRGIKASIFQKDLLAKGYTIVALETGYYFTELTQADIYIETDNPNEVSPFEFAFLDTTMFSAWNDLSVRMGKIAGGVRAEKLRENELRSHPDFFYRLKMNGFKHFDQAIDIGGPKFVFAHLMGVHKPLVLGKNGELSYSAQFTTSAYLDQLEYVNSRMIQSLERLLKKPGVPPIIILLSDHGFRFDDIQYLGGESESVYNFAAVYGPSGLTDHLYDTITPVNVMRLTAGYVLDKELSLLPDHSFFQKEYPEGMFLEVPNSCK